MCPVRSRVSIIPFCTCLLLMSAFTIARASNIITSDLLPEVIRPGDQSTLTLAIVDANGDPVSEASVRIDLMVSTPGLLVSYESPVYTDASGRATSELIADASYGLVTIESSSIYPAQDATLSIDPRLVSWDEPAPESDPLHNSHSEADLTAMYAWLSPDTMNVSVDFASSWDYTLLMVALETNADAAGAVQDAFDQPIFYGHALKPDYVFTYKYGLMDYADLRRWQVPDWGFWHVNSGVWITDDTDPGKNAVSMVERHDESVRFRFPLEAIGALAPGDTVRLQSYVSQETPDVKYNALDSNPHDATNDMEPDVGEWWETATLPVTLTNYATHVFPAGGAPPVLSSAVALPETVWTGEPVTVSVEVTDGGGGVGDVFADFSPLGGSRFTVLHDDGTGGDGIAADGIYSAVVIIPADAVRGDYVLSIKGRDSLNVSQAEAGVPLSVEASPELIKSVTDPTGDDHGPSITTGSGAPVSGLYYYYPGNGVFVPGAFDIEQVDLTLEAGWLIIRMYVGDLPSTGDVGWGAPIPGATCENPNKAELNLQKIDVYIDSQENAGATTGFPYRFVDIADHDAWEFGVAVEGWYKVLIESHGDNSPSGWTLHKRASAIDVCNDHVEDYIDIRIALSLLGSPSLSEINSWDFIVTLAGHDGESTDQNLGGIRWVRWATSAWQFGNGRDAVDGREMDANIIDVATLPGEGKSEGRSQQEMLNYLLPAAVERFNNGQTACVLEATSRFNWVAREVKLGDDEAPGKSDPENRAIMVESGPGTAPKLFRFYLPDRCYLEFSIHDVSGRQVRMLASRSMPKGECSISWDGCAEGGGKLSPGVYFARLKAGPQIRSAKVVLLR